MHCSRRSLMGLGLAGIGALALPRAARAGALRNLVIVFARGGWDPVWAIDPKDSPEVDSPAGAVETFLGGQIDVLTAPDRPNVAAFFDAWASRCAVVRGIDVGAIAHFGCHVRMMTGTRTELNPDLGMIAAVAAGDDLALPYADIGGGAYAGAYAARMGRLGARNQVVTLIDREKKSYTPATQVDYTDKPLLLLEGDEPAQIQAYVEARAARLASGRAALGDNARRLADYRECFARADKLRAIPELQTLQLGGSAGLAGQIGLAITMLDGTSRAVYLDSKLDWDTHDNIADQGANHDALFGDLALLMQSLAAADLLDTTTVVVMSEMGRTPKLNAAGPTAGKDHWPTTSAMVLGAGVRAGTYGGTDDRLNARKVDLVSGAADDGGTPLRYDNFAAGVLQLVGVDNQEWLPDVVPMQGFIDV